MIIAVGYRVSSPKATKFRQWATNMVQNRFHYATTRHGVSPGTAKSDLKDLSRKGYLTEIALNGKTKGYIRSTRFHDLIQMVQQQTWSQGYQHPVDK